ncbi:MAG: hypothetical protein M1826_002213 [Phylliscum demangeonii]|nr:MAG: hypothetical protein M1826_002213 [Phylliscum demangeonii]
MSPKDYGFSTLNPDQRFEAHADGRGGFFYQVASALLFWEDDLRSCSAVTMLPASLQRPQSLPEAEVKGSLSLLWPLFEALCLSQFIETLSCTIQGRPVMAETGMTLFEHSLAFAETEGAISNKLGFGPFASSRPAENNVPAHEATDSISGISAIALKRSSLLSRFNATPEVLFIALISGLGHLTSHVLGVFGVQGKYRLWSTGFWGSALMGTLIWSALAFPADSQGIDILRFPTVSIVGFIPHVLILVGIGICALVYSCAMFLLFFSTFRDSDEHLTTRQRLDVARENLQANIHFSSIRVSRHEDFFSALLKVGFTALTAASEAVFLNEGRPIGVRRWTWLEEDRMNEVMSARAARRKRELAISRASGYDHAASVAEGIGLADEPDAGAGTATAPLHGGYAKEKGIRKLKVGEVGAPRIAGGGVGATERSNRWLMVGQLFRGISWLMVEWLVAALGKVLEECGMQQRPGWMTRVLYGTQTGPRPQAVLAPPEPKKPLEFWMLSDDGLLSLPSNNQVDVEREMRKRMAAAGRYSESELDRSIYGWWKQGGWFGELDGSGDFTPAEKEFDTTSVCTESDAPPDAAHWHTEDDDSDADDDGRSTPTKENPYPRARDGSPLPHLTRDVSHLARLLNPRTPAQKQEAELLSRHLRHPTPLTRSQYQQMVERERTKVLTSDVRCRIRTPLQLVTSTTARTSDGHTAALRAADAGPLSSEDEAELLEQLILLRRSEPAIPPSSSVAIPASTPKSSNGANTSWTKGGAGLGSDGPQCVVCQTSPRTILVWPCRCLSLCEDCRVSLAMNNFGSCVCCRRDVLGFSRIYVP